MRLLITPLLLFIISLCSCNTYKEVKNNEVQNAFILNSSASFKGYYYIGSDSDFHYFSSKWDFKRDRNFRIATDQLKVRNTHSFNSDKKELRIDLFGSDSNLFAENEYYKLYEAGVLK